MVEEEDREDKFKKYGWKTSEKNLSTLPETAPQAAKDLAMWLTLDGRKKSLVEWLGCVSEDNRIHGKFWHIGSWTHRMSHTNPNQANIFSPFSGTPKSPVEEVKERYDLRLRSLWKVKDGSWLVGTDAEGIQLRLLAHFMKSKEYVDAIVSGKKEDETDIHNVNKKALGSVCRTRDDAKTFIYAFILGASIPKVAEILHCNTPQASIAVNQFYEALPGLKTLKSFKIPTDASRGYFNGLDGRKVKCNSEHLMLAGYLQNGESTIMKHANVLWRKELKGLGIKFSQVDFVHDEWQTEVFGSKEEAEEIGRVQRHSIEQVGRDLGVFCPLAGSTSIGLNWGETH